MYPKVTLKMAQSLDGKIATRSGHSNWITSEQSRRFVQKLRLQHDGVLVGKNTFSQDNPRLSVRGKENSKLHPAKIVIYSPDLKLPKRVRVFDGDARVVFLVAASKMKSLDLSIFPQKAKVVFVKVADRNGKLTLSDALKKLKRLGIDSLLVEGGGELAWSLIKGGWVHKVYWMVAPKIIGGREATTSVEGEGVLKADQAFGLNMSKVWKCGKDWVFEGSPQGRR